MKNGADILILQYKENNQRIGGKDGLSIEEYTKEQDKLIESVLENFKKMALPIPVDEPRVTKSAKRTKSLFKIKKNRISPVSQSEQKETEEDDEDGRRQKRKKRSKRRSKKRSKKR